MMHEILRSVARFTFFSIILPVLAIEWVRRTVMNGPTEAFDWMFGVCLWTIEPVEDMKH